MSKFLSFEAEKFRVVIWLVLAVVFGVIAFGHWSDLAQVVARTSGPVRKQPQFVFALLAAATFVTSWIASMGLALLFDLITRRGLFAPGRRSHAQSVGLGVDFQRGQAPQPYVAIPPERLGAIQYRHHLRTPVRRRFTWPLGIVLLIPAIISAFTFKADFPLNIFGPVWSLLLFYIIYQIFTSKPADLTLHIRVEGLDWTHGKDRRAYRWSDIQAIRDWVADIQGYDKTTNGFEIQTSDGRSKSFSAGVQLKTPRSPRLAQFVSAPVTEHLLPRYRGLLRAQQRLDFGPASLDAERLYFGVRSILLSEIERIQVSDQECAFYKRGEKMVPFASLWWSEIWNPLVLVRLVRELAQL